MLLYTASALHLCAPVAHSLLSGEKIKYLSILNFERSLLFKRKLFIKISWQFSKYLDSFPRLQSNLNYKCICKIPRYFCTQHQHCNWVFRSCTRWYLEEKIINDAILGYWQAGTTILMCHSKTHASLGYKKTRKIRLLAHFRRPPTLPSFWTRRDDEDNWPQL